MKTYIITLNVDDTMEQEIIQMLPLTKSITINTIDTKTTTNIIEIMQIAKITSVILAYIKDKEEQQQIKNN